MMEYNKISKYLTNVFLLQELNISHEKKYSISVFNPLYEPMFFFLLRSAVYLNLGVYSKIMISHPKHKRIDTLGRIFSYF